MLERNRARRQAWAAASPEADFDRLRAQAQADVLDAVRRWMELQNLPLPCSLSVGEGTGQGTAPGVILTGHQPEIFHPGVWIKNFAAVRLAHRLNLTPINLIVDNDIVRSASVSVPRWGDAVAVSVPLDRWAGPLPYEEWQVCDEEYFARFADRALAALGNLDEMGFTPLLASFWAEVCRARSNRVGERLAAARHSIEQRWGVDCGELPVSRLAETPAFVGFIHHLLARLPQFHRSHNACLHVYRAARGMRSRSHPVADLAVDGDWLEAPFWAWRRGDRRRTRPFFRPLANGGELRLGQDVFVLPTFGARGMIVTPWADTGWKLRPRALTTTLFCRLFVADLFIHGIGGAIYDELTDALIRDFYGIEPPEFLVLSATLHLPVVPPPGRPDIESLERLLRDLHWNPDRHLSAAVNLPEWAAHLAAEKRELMSASFEDRAGCRRRFQRFREINDQLRPFVAALRLRTQQEYENAVKALARYKLAMRRDYAFALYPEDLLQQFYAGVVAGI